LIYEYDDPTRIEELEDELAAAYERIRQLEAERDQWQRQAVSNG
jgi:membrane protein involved in colicin uptake